MGAFVWSLAARTSDASAVGFHWVVWCLYVIVAWLVGTIGARLTGSQAVGLVSAGIFAVTAFHSEPVLWLSASNEVFTSFWLLLSTLAVIRVCESPDRLVWPAAALITFSLALATKETAVFLFIPVGVLLYSRRDRWSVALIMGVLAVTFFSLRLLGGSPYPLADAVWRVPLNLGYYLAVGVAGVPEHYAYSTGLQLATSEPGLLLTATLPVALGVALLAASAWPSRRRIEVERRSLLILAGAWTLAALLPVIGTATGRTLFQPSIGVAWIVGTGAGLALSRPYAVGLGLVIVGNFLLIRDRTHWWRTSGIVMASSIVQIEDRVGTLTGARVCLESAPDHLRHAYLFRNAARPMGLMLWPSVELVGADQPEHEPCDTTVQLRDEDDR